MEEIRLIVFLDLKKVQRLTVPPVISLRGTVSLLLSGQGCSFPEVTDYCGTNTNSIEIRNIGPTDNLSSGQEQFFS
jgi:hypothetical protein